MAKEFDEQEKLTGIDRQLQILNGIAGWVQGLDEGTRSLYIMGGVRIPDNIFSIEMARELVQIGIARQVLDAAMSGISVTDPREVVSS